MDLDLDEHLPAIQSGDADAFGAWLAHAEPPLRQSLSRFAARVDVEAILQEALLRVWQVAPRVEPDSQPNGLLRFAHVTAKNLAISAVRRHDRAAATAVAAAITETEEITASLPDPFLREAIQDCRNKLPKKPGLALTARLQTAGATSDHALAASLEMATNTFLQNFTRARRLLADCLRRAGIELAHELP